MKAIDLLVLVFASGACIRLPAPLLQRRAVLVPAAALCASGAVLPPRARAETLVDIVNRLGAGPRSEDTVWATAAPKVAVGPTSLISKTLMPIQLTASAEAGVDYLWLRRAESRRAISAFKRGSGQAGYVVMLSKGSYVPCAYSSEHGLWEGEPFTIGDNPAAR